MSREIKCVCGYETSNNKSYSNHVRYGCKNLKFTSIPCLSCGKFLPKRKPSDQGFFCNRSCYSLFRSGSRRGAYKEGSVMISGYKYLYNPTHVLATKKGYVAEHRLVAEIKVGRPLNENEIAHHINENKLDNRPENIKVMTKSEHSTHHQNFRKCKIDQ